MAKRPEGKAPVLSAPSTLLHGKGKLTLPDGYVGHAGHGTKASFTSIRNAIHRGQKIRVRTTYRIEIEGEPLRVHTTVMDDGQVHCHGLPNYSFASAVDLARAVVDTSALARAGRDEIGPGAKGAAEKGRKARRKTAAGGHH